MPLPLPNLDTRRWADMVDEGRALIPRYAPTWTDHNIHDVGITIMELLAWLVEQDIYHVNRVPDRHRRKFLALAGFAPQPPQPAQTPLTFSLMAGAGTQTIPPGLILSTGAEGTPYRFRTATPLTAVPVQLMVAQSFDGLSFADQTRAWQEGLPFPPWGDDPKASETSGTETLPALYLGFDDPLPLGEPVTLWFWFDGDRSHQRERTRLLEEAEQMTVVCRPSRPQATCEPVLLINDWCQDEMEAERPTPDPAETILLPPHHGLQTIWEYYDGSDWHPLDAEAGEVEDETRGFTLDGSVRLTLPAAMASQSVGGVTESFHYIRCRLASGRPDTTPHLLGVALNTVLVEQSTPIHGRLRIAAGVTPPIGQSPLPGTWQPLHLTLNSDGEVTQLAAGDDVEGPTVFVLDYQPAASALTITLISVGTGTGLPQQQVTLPDAPIADGQAQIWIATSVGLEAWQQRPDLDASERIDADFMIDAMTGTVTFGDGEQGRVVPQGAIILATYETTVGAAGNIGADAPWQLIGADDTFNNALLAGDLVTLDNALDTIRNSHPATSGTNTETITHTAGRAAEALWAHERLLELCEQHQCRSLDQLDRSSIMARVAPLRATTLIDYERIALEIPGTQISRAKAWAGLDPQYPCLKAPGTVTVIIVPGLPLSRPVPTPGLLEVTQRYLDRRRTIGTRLVVVGPTYLTVSVRADVQTRLGADLARIHTEIIADLNRFLDPLVGGPAGLGWPFGRDVYRSEILQVIDQVAGVDHVLSLALVADGGEAQCGNLCVGPTWLVTPDTHEITVVDIEGVTQ